MKPERHSPKAWVIAADMGYGHERAAYALKHLAWGSEVLIANRYPGIPQNERGHWQRLRRVYETVSRIKALPVVGDTLFDVMDHFQQIEPFYPRRDLSGTNMQLKETYRLIHQGLGKHLIDRLRHRPLPLISTFFQAAFAAEEHEYPGDIYCVICDADCSRTWAPLTPRYSRIKYLAPTGRIVERLKLYGIKPENIYLTGFPLPKELIGGAQAPTLKRDLARRLKNLDPRGIFTKKYSRTIAAHLGARWRNVNHAHPLTVTFSVGGAGAQKAIGVQIMESLHDKITQGKVRLNLVAGTHHDAARSYLEAVRDLKLQKYIGRTLNVIHGETRLDYFRTFSELLHTTDILWTKPSELSFYCGLGIPIIMAPPIGSQEQFNRLWLKTVGGGLSQNDARYTNEWLFDWVNSGGLARIAWSGFIEAPTHGTYRIESIITGKRVKLEELPLIV